MTRRREYETPEFAAMLRRMIRRYAVRVADADDVDLGEMVAMRAELDAAILAAVAGQVERGASWTDVGRALGITRQAAWKRFGAHVPGHEMLLSGETVA